jgi:hypothetical protein
MKLSQLTAKPKLITISVDDAATIEEFGEALEFYTWDRQPMDVFLKIAASQEKDLTSMVGVVKDLILDENGKPVINNENMLPTHVLVKCIGLIVEKLGK